MMDCIVMHGVYSWVSPALRQAIVRFIERRLKPGGVVYVSYNTLPGWAPLLPLRELFHLHASRVADPGSGAAGRLQGALDFIGRLAACEGGYVQSHPAVAERLRHAQVEGPNYALHEYVGPDSHPLYFHQVAAEFEAAGLSFAAPALLAEQVDAACVPEELAALLQSTPDPVLRETLRDYGLNRAFRRDLFVRGGRRWRPPSRPRACWSASGCWPRRATPCRSARPCGWSASGSARRPAPICSMRWAKGRCACGTWRPGRSRPACPRSPSTRRCCCCPAAAW